MQFNRETLTTLAAHGVGITISDAVTPFDGGGWDDAVQLDYGITPVNNPANPDDSLALPAAVAGKWCLLFAVTGTLAHVVDIWPLFGTLDTINGADSDDAQWQTSESTVAIFSCFEDGVWLCNLPLD